MDCPYCKEEIHDDAIKCKHCGSFLNQDATEEGGLGAFSYFLRAYRHFANFSGRARRKEYWFFMLFYMLIAMGLIIVDGLLGLYIDEVGMGVLSGLFMLVSLIPSIAVGVRRLHDINRTGWWMLLLLVPLGVIVLIVFFCQTSKGQNRYGSSPLPA